METWVENQRKLLQLERNAEMDEAVEKISQLSAKECEDLGVSLLSLVVDHTSTGLYGRSVVTLCNESRPILPAHTFKPGDVVVLKQRNATKHSTKGDDCPQSEEPTGIVSKVQDGTISVAFDKLENEVRFSAILGPGYHRKFVVTLLAGTGISKRFASGQACQRCKLSKD
jgi:hypothetical protein